MKRRRFHVRNLLLGWTAYWLALIVIGLARPIGAIWRMSQVPHGKGTVNAGVADGIFTANVLQNGVTTWTGSVSVISLALLVALPPLIMWAIFLLAAPRTINAGGVLTDDRDVAELQAGQAEAFKNSGSTSKRRSREGS